jgi:hypothetical protein
MTEPAANGTRKRLPGRFKPVDVGRWNPRSSI